MEAEFRVMEPALRNPTLHITSSLADLNNSVIIELFRFVHAQHSTFWSRMLKVELSDFRQLGIAESEV